MAKLTYRIDVTTTRPTTINTIDVDVNEFLTNDQINKNFFSLNKDIQAAKEESFINALLFGGE